ncbi:DUF5753 domain-containing protein [Streptomyces sp. B6B3]|uniref:DUF5753 domain-containing protein n=1 Tax=Streptomyces sp. B6B3 TaxID=3153570 RepID=UPI00325E9223
MTNSTGKGWWSEYRAILDDRGRDLAELESTVTGFRTVEWLYVPGLLQTPDYMRELFVNGEPSRSSEAIKDRVEFRMRRQEALTGPRSPSFHAVVHEAAFHMHFVGRDTMRAQLDYLVELSQFPSVAIQLLPFRAESHPVTPGAPFTIHDVGVTSLRTVHVEHPVSPLFLCDGPHVDQFTAAFRRLTMVGLEPLDPSESREGNSMALVQHLRYVL